MKTFLTPQLLGFLIERGFTYCLSKTVIKSGITEIILKPIKAMPASDNLTGYVCYKITREPVQMAGGVEHHDVYVDLG